MAENITYSALAMDRDVPIGNSIDSFGRRALHTVIGNDSATPVPVYITSGSIVSAQVVNTFNQITGAVTNIETAIVSYTVPLSKKFLLSRVQFSGTNISTYNFYADSSLLARFRTMFGNDLSGELQFDGLEILAGQTLTLTTTNPRGGSGEYDGRIVGLLRDA